MTRRNILPNSKPDDTTGWSHLETDADVLAFETDANGLRYKVLAAGPDCEAHADWADPRQITVRPGERYGIRIPVTVDTRPDVGLARILVTWKEIDGVTSVGSPWIGTDLPAGATEVLDILTAPAGAVRLGFTIDYTLAGDDPDLVTPVEIHAAEMLIEPLGPPKVPVPGAVTNLVKDPALKYGGYDWLVHSPTNDAVADDATFEVQDGWDPDTNAMRFTITSGDTVVGGAPPEELKGFIGAYIGPIYYCNPGDVVRVQVETLALAGPATGPGLFPELFFDHYDGDPAHTAQLLQVNGPSFHQPLLIGTPQTLEVSGEAPDGGIGTTVFQPTIVMATTEEGVLLDFKATKAIITINDVIAGYFDGDTDGAGWTGFPGRSTSQLPGVDARVPGDWFDGNSSPVTQWEGTPGLSMSSYQPPLVRHSVVLTPGPSPQVMRFLVAASTRSREITDWTIIDNGDGTLTLPDGLVVDEGDGTLAFTGPAVDNGDGTITIGD